MNSDGELNQGELTMGGVGVDDEMVLQKKDKTGVCAGNNCHIKAKANAAWPEEAEFDLCRIWVENFESFAGDLGDAATKKNCRLYWEIGVCLYKSRREIV